MTYGIIKVDTITFTDGGIDKSVSISGLVQNPTFSGNITVTGTISGDTVQGQTVSGVTVTGTTAAFTTGTFVSLTGTTTQGTTATYTTGSFTSLTGTTTQGTTASFTTGTFTSLTGTTTTGTTANFATGVFSSSISGAIVTATSGVIASGTAANPSLSIIGDSNTGIYSPGADQVAISTNGTGRLFIASDGRVGVGTASPVAKLHIADNAPYIQFEDIDNNQDWQLQATAWFALRNQTAATELLRVTTDGKLGLGTSSPSTLFHIKAGSNLTTDLPITVENSANSLRLGIGAYGLSNTVGISQGSDFYYNVGKDHLFQTDGTTKAVIKEDGKVGIGSTSPQQLLECASSASGGPAIRLHHSSTSIAQDTEYGRLEWYSSDSSAGGTGVCNYIGAYAINAGVRSALTFGVRHDSGVYEAMRINNLGQVGIGTTDPVTLLSLEGTQPAAGEGLVRIRNNHTTSGQPSWGIGITRQNNGTRALLLGSDDNSNASIGANGNFSTVFGKEVAGVWSEFTRIDSSGRLLVGTSTALETKTQGNVVLTPSQQGAANTTAGSTQGLFFYGTAGTARANLVFSRSNSATVGLHTVIGGSAHMGGLIFTGSDGTSFVPGAEIFAASDGTPGTDDMPGRLVFSTTADGASSPTERMRITNDGNFYFNNTNTPTTTQFGTRIGGGTTQGFLSTSRNVGGTETVLNVFGNAGEFRVRGDGDCENTNNSYAGLSDIKLKENVVDANSQWSDLKALQVRSYNFKAETGYNTHTQIGLIAQEVELVSPGLVSESPDRDEEDNDLGTTTKSVNYSVLYMKAVKALQEAMERIEVLEQRLTDAGIA